MSKEEYGAKECIEVIKANGVYNPNIQKYFDELEELLTEYEAIKNSNPSEALECLERIDNTLCLNNIKGKLDFGIDTEEHTDCDSVIGMTEDIENIKQALLKAQEQEKFLDDKLVFKNGCMMSGFEYKGKQIVAMPLEEYDYFMKQEKALEIIKRFIWIENDKLKCGRYADIEIELDKSDFENKEEYDLLKEVLE